MNPVVELNQVTKHYQRGDETVHALESISFAVEPGELVALVGPSGCGKSTLLNMISGVDRPDNGSIHVGGIDVSTAGEVQLIQLRRRMVGIVFQAFHLMPHLTVEENISLPLSLSRTSDHDRVLSLIQRVGLTHRASHYPSELSGGEQQRTAIARALVHRPAVVLADEPTGNLDSHSGQSVLNLMDELRTEEATALILATHDPQLARAAGRIIRLKDGQIDTGNAHGT